VKLSDDVFHDFQFILLHTPGHSPGSICLLFQGSKIDDDLPPNLSSSENQKKSKYILFTGDTYSYNIKENGMTGFPRYGHDLLLQAQTLWKFHSLPRWDAILPGHGLPRIYDSSSKCEDAKFQDIEEAAEKLMQYRYQ